MSRIKENPLKWLEGEQEQQKRKNKPITRKYTKSSQEGLQDNWTRATFIVREDLLEKLKALAYTNRSKIKDEINNALEEYLEGKETIERNE